jgi:2'-5' RNA ligase
LRSGVEAWSREALRDPALRPLPAASLHTTLVFLGYRPEKEIDRIGQVVAQAAEGRAAPVLRAVAVKPVPPRRPRLFALDLDDPGGAAADVQEAIADALARERLYKPEKRPFWPHITLARVKRGRMAPPLEAPPPPPSEWSAEAVTLYRSTLRPQGAVYTPLARVVLAPCASS